MKALIDLKTLKAALARVSTVPGAKGSIPESLLVKITADFEGLQFTRVTPEAVAIGRCEAEIHVEGDILLDFAKLDSFVDRCSVGPVLMEITGKGDREKVSMKAGRSAVTFDKIISNVEQHEAEEEMFLLELSSGELAEWIKATERAMATPDLGRPHVEGAIVQAIGGTLRFIGTDGRRVHCIDTGIPQQDRLHTLIPREVVACIKSVVSVEDVKTPVIIGLGTRQVMLRSPGLEVRAALYDVTIPSIEPVIVADKVEARVAVSPEEMIVALRAANPFGKDATKEVSLVLLSSSLTLIANDEKGAEFRYEIDLKGKPDFVKGASATFSCSASFALDTFQALTHKTTVTLHLSDDCRNLFVLEDGNIFRIVGMHISAKKKA